EHRDLQHGAGRRRRRPPSALEPGVGARRHRLEAALLRQRARLRVVAGAALPALRGHLPGLREVRPAGRGSAVLRGLHPLRDGALPVLRRGDIGLSELAGRPRGAAAQGAVPAHRDPAVGGADGAVQPRHDARRRAAVRAGLRCAPVLDLAAAAGHRRAGALLRARPRPRPVGALRALPRRPADLGGGDPGALLRLADPLRRHAGSGVLPARVPRQPDSGAVRPDAPRAARSAGADRLGGDRRRGAARRAGGHRGRRLPDRLVGVPARGAPHRRESV
ncbi:MAG: hypothetical protein AVDCRST_MAG65-2358, partial [uncultured Solirubrobacteraceae bacterium]